VLDGELVKVWRARTRAKRLVEEYPHHRAGSLCLNSSRRFVKWLRLDHAAAFMRVCVL